MILDKNLRNLKLKSLSFKVAIFQLIKGLRTCRLISLTVDNRLVKMISPLAS